MKISKVYLLNIIVGAICIWHFYIFAYVIIFYTLRDRNINLTSLLGNIDRVYLGFAYLICGINFCMRKSWARYLCIFLSSWSLVINLSLIYILKDPIATIAIICYVIIYLIILYIVTRPDIKALFR